MTTRAAGGRSPSDHLGHLRPSDHPGHQVPFFRREASEHPREPAYGGPPQSVKDLYAREASEATNRKTKVASHFDLEFSPFDWVL